ncbi:MAG: GNAT family N-acetyltransferase [Actinomycetota bacterium]
MTLRIQPTEFDDPRLRPLMEEYAAEVAIRHPAADTTTEIETNDPRDYAGSHGRFLLALLDGEPAGCGGVRLLGEAAEVKRMHVSPRARGRGVGKRMLTELERIGRHLGAGTALLDTSDRMHEAIGLYRGSGYRRIERYNTNPHATHWFEKTLVPYNDAIIDRLETMESFDHLGVDLVSAGPGTIELRLPITDGHCFAPGQVQAGPIISLGDYAAGAACFTTLPDGHLNSTVNVNAGILRSASGSHLSAIGAVVKSGRQLSTGIADVYAHDGDARRHVAAVTVTMANTADESSPIAQPV